MSTWRLPVCQESLRLSQLRLLQLPRRVEWTRLRPYCHPLSSFKVFLVCTSKDVCPSKEGKTALACTEDTIALTDREYIIGKELSCYCGGPDETTEYICRQQPGTNWQISVLPADENGEFEMTVLERAGIPSQVHIFSHT